MVIRHRQPCRSCAGDSLEIRKVVHALDQPGRALGSLITGNPPIRPPGWNYQVTQPCYSWNNTTGNAQVDFSAGPGVRANVHYFNDTPMPGYTPYVYPHPLVTGTGTPTPTPTGTPTPMPSATPTPSASPSSPATPTSTPTATATSTPNHLLRLHHHRHLRQLQQRHLRLAQLRLTLTATATRTGCSVMPPRAKQRSGI